MEVVRSNSDDSEAGDAVIEDIARDACAACHNDPSALVEVLHEVHRRHGDLPEAALRVIADVLNLSRAEVYGVRSYYHDFRPSPAGRRLVRICLAEACRSRGSGALFEAARSRLEADGDVLAVAAYCLGNCALSPAVMIDGVVHGRVADAEMLLRLVDGLDA